MLSSRPSVALVVVLLSSVAGCGSTGARPAAPAGPSPVGQGRGAPALAPAEAASLEESWRLFVLKDPRWPAAREAWIARGGPATQLLAENLFRYFWSASNLGRRAEVTRVAYEAAAVGEPAVAYFVKPLVTDRWPLKEPVTAQVFNSDNPKQPLTKTFTHYDIDDVTRQHAAQVLAAIGPAAVPAVAAPGVLEGPVPSGRRYAAYALGAIGSDDAVDAVARVLRTGATWQERGAAAKALGFALRKNTRARGPLEAARSDPDRFVREKAEEALAGRTKIEW